MHRYKTSEEKTISPDDEYPEATNRNEFMVCENLKCAHYDQHDPSGNNCSLLFALSEEGCGVYAA
jgi:hypothetical protein